MSMTKIVNRPLLRYGAGATPDRDPLLGQGVHNTYLQQVLYFGLPLGLLVSLALVGTAGMFLARGRSIAIAGVIGCSLMVQLVIGLFESSFEGRVLRVLFYLSMGLATALLRAVEGESASIVGGVAWSTSPRRREGWSGLATPRGRVARPDGVLGHRPDRL